MSLNDLKTTFASGSAPPDVTTDVLIGRETTFDDLKPYFRTWSAVHRYHEKHPEDKGRIGRGKHGDIVDRFVEEMKDKLPEHTAEVEIEWPIYMMMVKKAS